jgi:hypothetical protein
MARSSYVYVVMLDDKPVAGFTVKHEMKSWLEDQEDEFVIWRLKDGRKLFGETPPPVVMEDV